MGNCFTKPERAIQTSRSNSFTNVKFSSTSGYKTETNGGGRVKTPSHNHNQVVSSKYTPDNGKQPEVPPVKCVATGNSLYNSLYNEQSSPYKQRRAPDSANATPRSQTAESLGQKSGGTPSSSYRLRQEDVSGGLHMGTSSDFSTASTHSPASSRDSSKQNTLEADCHNPKPPDRAAISVEQQMLMRGHKRTESSDKIKLGHVRSGSSVSIISGRDRSDSTHKRFQADLIRKGSWTVNESKLQRSDSDQHQQPDITKLHVSRDESHPRILTDHIEPDVPSTIAYTNYYENCSITVPPQSAFSPLTRSDSCKNELNPVLRKKSGGNLQERRQVVSAMHIDLTAVSNSTSSSEEEAGSGSPTSPLQVNRRISENLQSECDCVIKWKKGNLLGKGSFGKVYSAMTSDGQIVAVKQIELNNSNWSQAEADYRHIQREVDIQKTLDHPNIVRFLDCGLDVAEFTINILMEHVSGGTIASLLKKFGTFEESVFRRYSSQLIDATTYLHSNNVIHRDIKGSNIMVTTTGFIKLIDFGTAKRTTDDLITPLSAMKLDYCIKGTPYWMAPEVVQMAGDPTSKADVWSIGCTVIEMATGSPPYFHMQPMSALFVIGSLEKPSPKLPEKFSQEARDFVDLCLIKTMQKRPTSAQLGKHPFILPEFIKQYPDNRRFYI